ncbi:sulfite exporter TauE/SafE family protein [bacterium]|nr:MAG: sulfite exporter TauE/SafE family protein [bacterium]
MIFALELVAIGGLTGVLSGLLGVGGGFIMIPLLNAAGFLMREAAGSSLLYVAFTAASGTLRHVKLGTVDPVLALLLLSGATPIAPVGSHYATILPNEILQIVFAFMVVGTAASYLRWGRSDRGESETPLQGDELPRRRHILLRRRRVGSEEILFSVNCFSALAIGGCIGFISGLLGVGGGWLLVPLLVLLMRTPLRIAVGTSLPGILLPAIVGAASHWRLGNLHLAASIPLILSGIVGAQLGALLVVRISHAWLEWLLIILLIVASAYMLGRGFGLL